MNRPNSRRSVRSAEIVEREELASALRAETETLAKALDDPELPIDETLGFFNDPERQRRLEDAEIHHDRAPLAGVVRELEADPVFQGFFAKPGQRQSASFRRIVGVLVRMIMERRGWRATGKASPLGVPSNRVERRPRHNANGLALWFPRAERFRRRSGMPFRTVRARSRELECVEPSVDREAQA